MNGRIISASKYLSLFKVFNQVSQALIRALRPRLVLRADTDGAISDHKDRDNLVADL